MLNYLTLLMREFIVRQKMVCIVTADAHGTYDCSFRAYLPGFIELADYPQHKGKWATGLI
jgi:hypothetical protein